jgi:hypothetical protein
VAPDAGATTLAAALMVAALFPRLLLGDVLFRRDVHLMWYTQTEALIRAVTAGEWPLWNPDVGFGQPLWADANVQILYPTTWLNLFLKPWSYYTAFVIAHLLLAALGARALGRTLGLGPLAATAAALLWLASGPLLSLAEIWNQLAGTAWMPWALAAAIRALQTGRRSFAAAWGAAVAAQVLAGAPEAVLITTAGAGAWALLATTRRRGDHGRSLLPMLRTGALAGMIALGLSAGQWLPSLAAAAESARAHLPPEARGYWSVHPLALVQLFFPLAADALRLGPRAAEVLFGGREPLLPSLYLGLATVPLALAALLGPRRRAATWLLAATASCLVVALGEHLPLHGLMEAVFPPLRALRYPVKAMPAAALGWALLGGLGVEAWLDAGVSGRRFRMMLAAVLLMTALAAAGAMALHFRAEAIGAQVLAAGPLPFARMLVPARDAMARAALAGLAMTIVVLARVRVRPAVPGLAVAALVVSLADLLLAHRGLAPTAPRALFTFRPEVVEAARPADHRRVLAYDYFTPGLSAARLGRPDPFLITRAPRDWTVAAATALSMRMSLFPPSAGPWGIAGSFDHDTPGIAPWRSAALVDALLRVEGTPAHARLLGLGAVSRVVALHRRGLEPLPLVAETDALLPEPVRVFAVPGALPRAHAALSAVVSSEDDAALRTLLDPGFDPQRTVVLAEPAGGAAASTSDLPSSVRLEHIGADRMRLEASLPAPGFVVLADAWTPGWTARVDGREARVLRANVAFRAVPVPAGRHVVELSYRAPGLFPGLALTGLTLAALLGMALRSKAKRREAASTS